MATKKSILVKNRILNCAEIVFAREGYKGASLREIASGAQCNQAMIHYYFGNKDKLYLEVFRSRWMPKELRVIETFKETIAAANDPTPAQLIEAYIRAYIDRELTDSEKQTQRLLIVREISNPGEAFRIVSEQINKPVTRIFLQHLENHLLEGTDEKRLTLNILAIYGMVYYFAYSHNMVSSITGREYSGEFKEELIHTLVDFSLNGMPLKSE